MTKVNNDNYCSIPFGGVFVHPTGKILPCCVLDPIDWNDNIKDHSVNEVFHNKKFNEFRQTWKNGSVHPLCEKKCINNSNNTAHRTIKSELIDHKLTDKNDPKIIVADIGFGNICNLSCSMCDETSSHTWAKIKNLKNSIWNFDKKTMLETAETLKDAKMISIKGGEPFNIPYLYEFLDRLTELNNDVVIDILSNGTEISDRDIESLKKIPNLHMSFSIEATGELYKYIRGGKYTFQNLIDNVKRLKEAGVKVDNICFASIIMFYNHRVWVDDHIYMTQIFKKELDIDVEIVSQICTFPANQNIFLIKNKLRKRLIKRIDTSVTRKEINLRDWTNLKKLLINDREVYNGNTLVTKKDVSNWILYMNSLRDMNFYKIFPNILDDLKDSIV